MEKKITSFKELKIWQKGIEIVKDVYESTKTFPTVETYGLTAQIRRAAISIPSNIAEGFKRYHEKEYRQFLFISLGSLAELETQLIIARELDYISQVVLDNLSEKSEHLSRMIYALMKKFQT
jgi:four helix bundle protein